MGIYKKVGERLNISETAVCNWVLDFEMRNCITLSKRGMHSKTGSLIMDHGHELADVVNSSFCQALNMVDIFK